MSFQEKVLYTKDGYGLVELNDTMVKSPALKAVNAARGSFGKRVKALDLSRDVKFLDWLAEYLHSSPFRHSYITLYVRAPEFVARQWYKHCIGSDYSFKDLPWSEISGRYVEYNKFYSPTVFYTQHKRRKQGRTKEEHEKSIYFKSRYDTLLAELTSLYKEMVEGGVSMEQARMVLPMSFYTEYYWTASPQAVFHFVNLRSKPDAQAEIQEYANLVEELASSYYGFLWDAMKLHWTIPYKGPE